MNAFWHFVMRVLKVTADFGRTHRLAATMLSAIFTGLITTLLLLPTFDRAAQKSAYEIVRGHLARLEDQATLARTTTRDGETLLFSTLSGNVESLVAGVSLPAHPQGGFIVSGGPKTGLVWRSVRVQVTPQTPHIATIELRPAGAGNLSVSMRDSSDAVIAEIPVPPEGGELRLPFTPLSADVHLAISVGEPSREFSIAWIRYANVAALTE